MLESSWARQTYRDQGEMSPYVTQDFYGEQMPHFNSSQAEIEGKLTFGKKRTLGQKLAKLFGAIEVKPLLKIDKYAEARQRKFADWLQMVRNEGLSVEKMERLFILKSNKDAKQLKDALLFLGENIAIKDEIGYDQVMRSYVTTISKIEDLIKQRRTTASESETLRREIIKEIISLPKENGLRRKVVELLEITNLL